MLGSACLYVKKDQIFPTLTVKLKDIPLFLNLPGKEKPYPTFSMTLPNGEKTKATLLHHTVIHWGGAWRKEVNLEQEIDLAFIKKNDKNAFFNTQSTQNIRTLR